MGETEDTPSDPRAETGGVGDSETSSRPLASAAGDRCATCGSPLASDQRYCVTCGERRGKARFSAASPAPGAPSVAARPEPRRPRMSSSAALIAGVGVLLLAVGVGVLIGRIDTKTPTPTAQRSNPVQVISVASGSGNGGTATTGSHPHAKATKKTSAGKHTAVVKKVVISKQVQAKAKAAAVKVLGGGAANIPNPVVTIGQPGHGPGYRNGHFTGQFFGP